MGDNTTLPVGAGGDTIRTVDRTTSKTQVVGLDIGGEAGPESIITPANPLPVTGVVQLSVDGLGPAGMDGALPVTMALDQPPIQVAQSQLGQQPMALSLPVTLASDQTSVVVTANQGVSPFNVAGSVSVSNFPATQPVSGTIALSGPVAVSGTAAISAAALPLPTNAAQETGGNLASLVSLTTQLQQLIELNKMILATLKADNLILASLAGTSVNPSDMLDDATLQ